MAAVIRAQDEAGAQEIPALDYVRAIAPYQAGKPIEELAREHGWRRRASSSSLRTRIRSACRPVRARRCRRRWPTSAAIPIPTDSS
jgi:hypothetical protein